MMSGEKKDGVQNRQEFRPLDRGTPEFFARATLRRREAAEKTGIQLPPPEELTQFIAKGQEINSETATSLEHCETLEDMVQVLERMTTQFGGLFPGGDKLIIKSLALKLRDHGSDYLARANRGDLVDSLQAACENWQSIGEIASWVEENVLAQYPNQRDDIIKEAKRQFIEDIRMDVRV